MINRAEIDELSPEEKIVLLDDVWSSLAQSIIDIGPSEAEERLLEERNREIETNPGATVSLEEFKRRLREGR